MINKEELKIEITTQELKGELSKTIEVIPPKTQEKECTPTLQTQEIIPDDGFTGLSKVTVNPISLENKSITITENTTTVVEPSEADGLSSVSITTNVEGDPSEYFENTITKGNSQYDTGWTKSIKKLPSELTASGTSLSRAFYMYNLNAPVPKIVGLDNVTNFYSMFERYSGPNKLDLSSWEFGGRITNLSYMFQMSNLQEVNLSSMIEKKYMGQTIEMSYMFYADYSLKKVNMSNFNLDMTGWSTSGAINPYNMFQYCTSMEEIDLSNLDFSKVLPYGQTDMFGVNANQGIPDNCLIYVKNQTEKDWVETNFPRLTNVQIKS